MSNDNRSLSRRVLRASYPRLIGSPATLRDLQHPYRFPAETSSEATKRAARTIREVVQIIAQQPGIGRPVDDMEPEYREWIIDCGDSGHVALYHHDGQEALILAVRHQREAGY